MSRIEACLNSLSAENRKALIPFITAGDPSLDSTVPILHALADSGADIIELGIPFSDPMADGPVIQLADERALANGVTTHHVLQMVAEFRRTNEHTPIVLMGYLNPIEVFGYQAFAHAAAEAGVDGMLTVDLPPEAAKTFVEELSAVNIDSIFLIAPTTSENRIKLIAEAGSGYLYYVSLKGVTGSGNLDVEQVQSKLETIRKVSKLPIAVGFGIKDAASAQQIGKYADGIIVGSAMVNKIYENKEDLNKTLTEVASFTQALRNGIDG